MAAGIPMKVSHDVALAKITPPRRSSLSIDRDGALQSLIECLSGKIVTVEAPVGSARSGFLAEAYRRLGDDAEHWRTAWLSVDDADDCDRLARHVLAALHTVWSELDMVELVRLYQENPTYFWVALSNFLLERASDVGVDVVLLVDDLHRAAPDAIAEFLNSAARYFPETVHVVASGNYLLWEHIDLAFRDEVRMFPSDKLNFSQDEVEAILRQAMDAQTSPRVSYVSETPIKLDARDLKALAADLWGITNGWSLGVRTYADALVRGSIDCSATVDERALGQMLNRFFRSSVLDALPEDLAQFVIEVALTDTVCADLCNALTGRTDSKFVLRDLRIRGCFLSPCANEAGWFEFHPLFRRWLRMKQGQMDANHLLELCRTASDWYEAHKMTSEAAKYLLMASDSNFIENLAQASGYESQRTGMSYFDWISRITAARFTESPQLALHAAWGYVICARTDEGLRWIEVFERAAAHEPGQDGPDASIVVDLFRAKCLEMDCLHDEAMAKSEAILRSHEEELSLPQRCLLLHSLAESYARRGRFDEALKNYLQAEVMAELGKSDFYLAMCRMGIISLRIAQGELKEALELCEKALAECPDTVIPYGSLLASKGYLCVEMDRLEEARECVERAHRIVSTSRNVDMLYEAEAERAHYYAAAGKHAQAFNLITKTALQMGTASVPRSINLLVHVRQAQVALAMGYIPEADAAARRLEAGIGRGDIDFELAGLAVRAAVDDASGSVGDPDDILPLVERACGAGLGLRELELSLRATERLAACGRHSDALMYLNRALRLQAGQQVVGPFLRAGGKIRALLHEIVDVRKSGGQARQLAKAVLHRFGANEAEETVLERTANPMARFGLTERECEVLELLDAGLSRREIAEMLTVSLNTVKSHVGGIYSKLGVTNRIDAFSIVHDGEDE
ncbi:MAG TPA: LuxR C-terminal-related transcriptional regulator [Gordonibacter urolithinfaciens]|uniref:LuxR C-terminal-related transcriptional regulator n=2 Tax=Gordonibacter urolithinfaciens TaxID=1335613 RepID=UPI001DEA2C6A|nr:LuxR C-terminal-related transcriptional regulator [Gordonibacter urolithinfaciens]HJF63321.1 LuxR C-terminal-related transcriptional regulator [Gordonibacter urolithinfaciens]